MLHSLSCGTSTLQVESYGQLGKPQPFPPDIQQELEQLDDRYQFSSSSQLLDLHSATLLDTTESDLCRL
eukprot:SAG25_NODE_1767_length_2372_cov_2.932688_4_plen_68_part_01